MSLLTSDEPSKISSVSLAVATDIVGASVKMLRRRISEGTVQGYRAGGLPRDEARRADRVATRRDPV